MSKVIVKTITIIGKKSHLCIPSGLNLQQFMIRNAFCYEEKSEEVNACKCTNIQMNAREQVKHKTYNDRPECDLQLESFN